MHYVYAVKSTAREYIYVGMTTNVPQRLSQNNAGQNRSTKAYRPFELLYQEKLETRSEARNKEVFLKSGIGKEYLRSLPSHARVAKLVDAPL